MNIVTIGAFAFLIVLCGFLVGEVWKSRRKVERAEHRVKMANRHADLADRHADLMGQRLRKKDGQLADALSARDEYREEHEETVDRLNDKRAEILQLRGHIARLNAERLKVMAEAAELRNELDSRPASQVCHSVSPLLRSFAAQVRQLANGNRIVKVEMGGEYAERIVAEILGDASASDCVSDCVSETAKQIRSLPEDNFAPDAAPLSTGLLLAIIANRDATISALRAEIEAHRLSSRFPGDDVRKLGEAIQQIREYESAKLSAITLGGLYHSSNANGSESYREPYVPPITTSDERANKLFNIASLAKSPADLADKLATHGYAVKPDGLELVDRFRDCLEKFLNAAKAQDSTGESIEHLTQRACERIAELWEAEAQGDIMRQQRNELYAAVGVPEKLSPDVKHRCALYAIREERGAMQRFECVRPAMQELIDRNNRQQKQLAAINRGITRAHRRRQAERMELFSALKSEIDGMCAEPDSDRIEMALRMHFPEFMPTPDAPK